MEPIRSDRSREFRRRAGRHREASTDQSGFSQRMADTGSAAAETEAIEEPSAVDPTLESVAIPGGVDAPTERLFDAVHQAGQRLLDQQTYSAAQDYRSAVQQFLRKVMPDANGIQIQESGHGILSRKRYYLLTEVNRSVDRLLEGLLRSQARQMDILRRLEEIRGMLIDLIH